MEILETPLRPFSSRVAELDGSPSIAISRTKLQPIRPPFLLSVLKNLLLKSILYDRLLLESMK